MKSSQASTFLGAGIVATSLLLLPLNIPAQAQTNTGHYFYSARQEY